MIAGSFVDTTLDTTLHHYIGKRLTNDKQSKGTKAEKNEPVEWERARKGLGIESLMLHLPSTHSITCLLFLRWWWWWWWWRGWRWGWQSYSHGIIPLHFLLSSPKIHSNLFSFLRETSLLVPDGARDSRRVRLRARDSLRCSGRAKAQCHLVRMIF